MANSPANDDSRDALAELERALESLPVARRRTGTAPSLRVEQRLNTGSTRADERFLQRFFGVCLVVCGIVTVIPAIYIQFQTGNLVAQVPIPRWVWILLFVGALHVVYATLVIQIPDYSSLHAQAVFLLVVTCVYGFAGVCLWLGDGSGQVAEFLQVPSVVRSRAAIWCGVMFGVSALGGYVFGREALSLRRKKLARIR